MDTAAKKKTRPGRRDELGASLISLARCCPLHERNPEDCLLFPVRKLKPSARLEWFNALTEDDLSFIAAYHHTCLNVKLAGNQITS
jgi:hypothetical protein